MITIATCSANVEHERSAQANNHEAVFKSTDNNSVPESGGNANLTEASPNTLAYWKAREEEAEAAAKTARRRQLDYIDVEEARAFLAQPRTSGIDDGFPAIVCASDLVSSNLLEPAQLIKGLLHQGSKMVLGGGSKSYKTWSLLDLAMSVANGKAWWGFETVKTKVLYINMELTPWSFTTRINDIHAARPDLSLRDLDVWNLRGCAVSFDEMRPKITERIKQGYGLIVIDPIYKIYGKRDENSAGDMGDLLNEIERLAVETGAAVVFGAHFSKGNQSGKESIDRISGSGVFARDPDTILVMTKHECEDTYTVDATLRNFKPIDSFCVERQHPLMVRNESLDPDRLKKPGFKTKYTADQLMDVLGEQSLTTMQWYLQVGHKTMMSKRTFMDKLKELKEDGSKLVQDKDEKWTAANASLTKEVGAMVQ